MLTKETTLKLCKFLITMGEEEKNLEVVRQILGEQPEFEPYAAFSRIDRARNGFITVNSIKEFLANNGFMYDDTNCQQYIQHYNFNDDGRLTFEQFLNSVLPQENQALRTIVTQRKTYQIEPNELLSYDVEYALARVFDREIQFFKKMDNYKRELKSCRDFTAKDAFYTIDMYNSNYIDFEKLGDFLMKQGYDLFEDQLIAIIRNMDKNDDGKIDLFEFLEAVEPRFQADQQQLFKSSLYKEQHDPVSHFKDTTKTTQQFYNNNQGIANPGQLFQQYIAPNQRTTLSIQKHVDNNRNSTILKNSQKKASSFSSMGTFAKNDRNPQQQRMEIRNQLKKEQLKKEKHELITLDKEICELARNLKLFIALDKEIEIYKQNLISRQDFTLIDAFRLFDIDGKGICQPGDFMTTLNALGFFPTKYELYLVLKRYDYDCDGKLSFQEFKEMLLPVKKEYEAMANERAPQHKDLYFDLSELWSFETRQKFMDLIKIMLQNEAAIESLRQRLNKRKHFNLKKIFYEIDQDADGFLRVADFKQIFDNAGILIEKQDIYYLILRLDRNNNAKVSYSEFINEIAPKSTQKF